MDKKVSFAHSLPYMFFLGFGFVRLIQQYSVLKAISEIARASSTHAIGYLHLPFDTFVVGVIGLTIGFLFKVVILRVVGSKQVSLRWLIGTSAVSICLLGSISVFNAYSNVEKNENRNAPQVIINSKELHKDPVNKEAISIKNITPAITLWDRSTNEETTVSWKERRIRTVVKDSVLVELMSDDVRQATLDLNGYT